MVMGEDSSTVHTERPQGECRNMPNHEIIRAWDEGYQKGQRDIRDELPCAECPKKLAKPTTPSNIVSMIEYLQRKRQAIERRP